MSYQQPLDEEKEELLHEYKCYLSESDDLEGLIQLYDKLANHVDPDEMNLLPLAAYYGFEDIIEFFLREGYNVNILNDVGTPLEIAARSGHKSIVEKLIQHGATVNTAGFPPLFHSVEKNHFEITQLLLKHGANVRAKPQINPEKSIIFYAKSKEMLALLLDNGADPDHRIAQGRSILFTMLKKDNREMVQLLVDKGVNINLTDNEGSTPLIYYFQRKNQKTNNHAYIPLVGKCDLNIQDANGNTALMYAILNGYRTGAMYLIQHSAKCNVGKYITAMSQCVMMNDKELLMEMIKYGADVDDGGTIFLATQFNLDMMQVSCKLAN
jgi:ankyrin repeat protein